MKELNIVLKRFIAFIFDLMFFAIFPVIMAIIEDITKMSFFYSDNLFYITLFIFLFKDLVFKTGSPGKRIMKLKIIENGDIKLNFNFKKVIRNFTSILWPIEALILIILKKRLSDLILRLNVGNNN